eukprot:3642550-Alexandrium_andersonii.AAC.1
MVRSGVALATPPAPQLGGIARVMRQLPMSPPCGQRVGESSALDTRTTAASASLKEACPSLGRPGAGTWPSSTSRRTSH